MSVQYAHALGVFVRWCETLPLSSQKTYLPANKINYFPFPTLPQQDLDLSVLQSDSKIPHGRGIWSAYFWPASQLPTAGDHTVLQRQRHCTAGKG